MIIRLVNAGDLIGCGGDPWPMRSMCGGVQGSLEVYGGAQRGVWRCTEMSRGAWRWVCRSV